jgi:hypothetical protein
MDAENHAHLLRLLKGQRFRASSRRLTVLDARLEGDVVVITFTRARRRPVSLELPPGFDPRSAEHVGWLLHNVERILGEADAATDKR